MINSDGKLECHGLVGYRPFVTCWLRWRRMWISCLWLAQLLQLITRRYAVTVLLASGRLKAVFSEDCDSCFIQTRRACLEYVRSGNKVFLLLALNVSVHACGTVFLAARNQ